MSLRTLPGFRHISWPPFTVVLVVPMPRISLLPFSPVTPLMTGPTGVSLERPQGFRIQMFTNVSVATRIQISIPLFFFFLSFWKHGAILSCCGFLFGGVWCHYHSHFLLLFVTFVNLVASLWKHMSCILNIPEKKKKASLTLNFLQGRWLIASLITVESWNAADSQPNYLESP